MITVAFIVALITGVVLGVVFWRMPERSEFVACLLKEMQNAVSRENDRFEASKEYLLAKGVIKC
jgi:hypothetical protein